jgi:hypothetical protein
MFNQVGRKEGLLMKKSFVTVLLFLIVCFTMAPLSYSEHTIFQLTDSPYFVQEYQMNNNNQVVWVRYDGSDNEIFLYDFKDVIQLTDNETDEFHPRINDNNQVVWGGKELTTDSEIFLYDGTNIIQLTDDDNWNGNPCINNKNQVVWFGGNWPESHIFLYDGTSVNQLTDDDAYNTNPKINNYNQVVWVRSEHPHYEIVFDDLDDGLPPFVIGQGYAGIGNLKINDNGQVVWDTHSETAPITYVARYYNGDETLELEYLGSVQNRWPDINNNNCVVWCGDGKTFLRCGGSTVQITDDCCYDGPRINNNNYVVGCAIYPSPIDPSLFFEELFLYDGSMPPTRLTDNNDFEYGLAINDWNYVMWLGSPSGDHGQLYRSPAPSIIGSIKLDNSVPINGVMVKLQQEGEKKQVVTIVEGGKWWFENYDFAKEFKIKMEGPPSP